MARDCIAVLATVDTKEPEARYAAGLIAAAGFQPLLLDVGSYRSHSLRPDYPCDAICRLGGADYAELLTRRRDQIMATMGQGAARVLQDLYAAGALAGALGLGGNQGTAVAAIALRSLPFGFPKLIVSTVASGNIRPYIQYKDIAMLFAVADLLGGPNTVSRSILANAVAAVAGMARSGLPLARGDRPVIAVTAFGNTNPAVLAARALLAARGYEVIAFHASGACGSAMEELIESGYVQGVLDLTTHELIGEVLGDDIYAPMKPRLEAAGRLGIPQVIAPGGLDYFCFGPPESVPAKFRGRPTHFHNPYNLNVKATAAELKRVGEVMAAKLNRARGPVAVFIPLRGFAEISRPGGPLHDPAAGAALAAALEAGLLPGIELHKVPLHLNDPEFAQLAAGRLAALMERA